MHVVAEAMADCTGNLSANVNVYGLCRTRPVVMTTPEMSAMVVVLALVFLASVLANVLVVVVFCKRTSLLTISNRFVANLTVCNCLNTVFVMPFFFVSLVARRWIFGSIWCQATGFFINVVVGASTLTLVVISVDRYCAVVTPLHYTLRVTSRRCALAIAGVWLVAVVSSLPPLLGWNRFMFQQNKMICTVTWGGSNTFDRYYTLFLVSLCFLLPLIAMLWTYSVIFRAARNNSERTRRSSIVPTAPEDLVQSPLKNGRRRSSSVPILTRRLSASSRSGSLLMRKEEWKAAVTSFLVVFTFILCWLPYFIVIVLESVWPGGRDLHPVIGTTSILTAMLSCACNPLVYVFRNRVMRAELRAILFPKRTKAQKAALQRHLDNMARARAAGKALHVSSTNSTLISVETAPADLEHMTTSVPVYGVRTYVKCDEKCDVRFTSIVEDTRRGSEPSCIRLDKG